MIAKGRLIKEKAVAVDNLANGRDSWIVNSQASTLPFSQWVKLLFS